MSLIYWQEWAQGGEPPCVLPQRPLGCFLSCLGCGGFGDARLYSKANLGELAKGAGNYILAAPIRRVKESRDEVLSLPVRYADIVPNLRAKEALIFE